MDMILTVVLTLFMQVGWAGDDVVTLLPPFNHEVMCNNDTLTNLKIELQRAQCISSNNSVCFKHLANARATNTVLDAGTVNRWASLSLTAVPAGAGFVAWANFFKNNSTNGVVSSRVKALATALNRSAGQSLFTVQNAALGAALAQRVGVFGFVVGTAAALLLESPADRPVRTSGSCQEYSRAKIPVEWVPAGGDSTETNLGACKPVYNVNTVLTKELLSQDDETIMSKLRNNKNSCAYYSELILKMRAENDAALDKIFKIPLAQKPICEADGSNSFFLKGVGPGKSLIQFNSKFTGAAGSRIPGTLDFFPDAWGTRYRIGYAQTDAESNYVPNLISRFKKPYVMNKRDFSTLPLDQINHLRWGPDQTEEFASRTSYTDFAAGQYQREGNLANLSNGTNNFQSVHAVSSVVDYCCNEVSRSDTEECLSKRLNLSQAEPRNPRVHGPSMPPDVRAVPTRQ